MADICIDRGDRILAGEAGVAKPRLQVITGRLSHRSVEAVDRNESKAIHPDKFCHARDVKMRRQKLIAQTGDPLSPSFYLIVTALFSIVALVAIGRRERVPAGLATASSAG